MRRTTVEPLTGPVIIDGCCNGVVRTEVGAVVYVTLTAPCDRHVRDIAAGVIERYHRSQLTPRAAVPT